MANDGATGWLDMDSDRSVTVQEKSVLEPFVHLQKWLELQPAVTSQDGLQLVGRQFRDCVGLNCFQWFFLIGQLHRDT